MIQVNARITMMMMMMIGFYCHRQREYCKGKFVCGAGAESRSVLKCQSREHIMLYIKYV
jgi:hypothetical protein